MPRQPIAPESSVSTYGVPGSTSIPFFQSEGNMARQDQPPTFVFESNTQYQGWSSTSGGFPGGRLGQPIFGTLSITSFHPAHLSADGINLTTNDVLNGSCDSVSTVNPRANSSFGFPTCDRWVESPGLNVLANPSHAVQREQSTNSTASSSHVQV